VPEQAELRECPRLSEDEIKEVATGLVKGHYFCATQCPPDMIGMVFMVIGLGGLGDIDPETVGNIIEHLDKAGPRSINGYPTFFSCRVIHRDDWSVIVDKATAAQAAMDGVLGEEGLK
jgi:hypothetical protein